MKSYGPEIDIETGTPAQAYFNENHWCKADFLHFSTDIREGSKTYIVGKNKQISRAEQHMSFLSEGWAKNVLPSKPEGQAKQPRIGNKITHMKGWKRRVEKGHIPHVLVTMSQNVQGGAPSTRPYIAKPIKLGRFALHASFNRITIFQEYSPQLWLPGMVQ